MSNNPVGAIDPSGAIEIKVAAQYKRRTELRLFASTIKSIREGDSSTPKEYLVSVGRQVGPNLEGTDAVHDVIVNKNFQDQVTELSRQLASGKNDIRAEDVDDFIRKLKQTVARAGEKVTKLQFLGHGGGGIMMIADDELDVPALRRIQQREPNISDLFAANARITLGGCNCGEGNAGETFARTLADTFLSRRGGLVTAYRGDTVIKPHWLFGPQFKPVDLVPRFTVALVRPNQQARILSYAEQRRRVEERIKPYVNRRQ